MLHALSETPNNLVILLSGAGRISGAVGIGLLQLLLMPLLPLLLLLLATRMRGQVPVLWLRP